MLNTLIAALVLGIALWCSIGLAIRLAVVFINRSSIDATWALLWVCFTWVVFFVVNRM